MLRYRENLRKDIRNLVVRGYIFQSQQTRIALLSKKMLFQSNVPAVLLVKC